MKFWRLVAILLLAAQAFAQRGGGGRQNPALAADAAAGTLKAPELRNIEFSGPYFQDEREATLRQVLQLYGRKAVS